MRWFCVAFGTLVVVSTALSRAGSPMGDSAVKSAPIVAASIPTGSTPAFSFGLADLSNSPRMNQRRRGAGWRYSWAFRS